MKDMGDIVLDEFADDPTIDNVRKPMSVGACNKKVCCVDDFRMA